MNYGKGKNNEPTGESILFKNILKHKKEIAISLFGFVIIAVSLLLFIPSLNKTYIGVSLHLIDSGWVVQSIDSSGLGQQAGIKIGDSPTIINGQSASDFLQAYEEPKQCLGLLITDITVINKAGESISATIENSSPPPQYITELIPYLIVCIIFWLTAYYVFYNKPRSAIAILLLLCSLTFGLAILGNVAGVVRIPNAMHLAIMATIIGPWLLLHFFLILPAERSRLRNNPYVYLIYLPAIITLILYPFIGHNNSEPTMWFRSIRAIELIIGFLAVIGVAIYNYISAVSPRTRQQMRLLLYFCIAAVAPFLVLSLLPTLVTGDILISSSFSVIFIALIPIGMGYAVMTQKLLDINVFIRRGVIYAAISLVIAAIFALVIILMLFNVQTLSVLQAVLIALVMGILASLLFGPVKNGIEFLVDKFFYKDKYDYRKTIQELGSALNSITDIVTGSTLIVNTLAKKINLEGACLFTATENEKYEIVASIGIYTEDEHQQQMINLLSERNSSIIFPNSAVLVNPNVEFLIPLIASDKEIGGICLSPKATKQRYSSDDLFLIQGLAPVVAISLRSWILIAADIAERKRTEEKLRQAAEEWQITFDSIPMPVSLQSNNFKILRVNKAYADLFNVQPDDIAGKTCYQIVHQTEHPLPNCPHLVMLSTNESSTIELHYDVFDRYFEITAFPIRNPQDEIIASVHIMRDITQVKKAEEEKRLLQEKAEISSRLASVGEMAAGIAHEINNPLTGVIGFSDMLLERELPQDMKEQVEIIANGSRRVADIVKRLLTFARQHKPAKAMVNVNELIENTLNMRNYVLKTNNIDVNVQYDTGIPLITIDPGQIQQVFLNLIINAEYSMRKTGKAGELKIVTQKIGDKIRIAFSDSGLGISEENIKKLFQPFFTTKPVGEGTGLGLSLSRSIIAEHGGTISVESEVNNGATFIIELPVTQGYVQDESFESAPSLKTKDNIKKINVLVVDDEPTIRQFIKSTLNTSDYAVETIGDPYEAMQKIVGNNYDLIIIDIRMPGMSGQELFEKAVNDKPYMSKKVLFTTGDSSNSEVKNFLQKYNLHSISKPFDRQTLESKIREVLG
ncbi:MAG: response regulator [Dehalococcoidales bacterium]|nr:response regulator [Dehalococcoidales bacterium]